MKVKEINKKLRRLYDIRIYFTLIVISEITIATFASSMITKLLDHLLNVSVIIPDWLMILVMSVAISLAFSLFLNHRIFAPIIRLSRSMSDVAKGDFKISLETDSRIDEIQEIYASFNLMVRELNATEILQTDFVSNVSHELKTPITAIDGYATLLQDSRLTDEERAAYTGKILLNTQRLSELAGNVLLLSRIDNQVIPGEENEFRLDEQIRRSIVLLEPKWSKKNIDFDVDLQEVTFHGNESLMLHIWNNLIDNAVKFDPDGGYVGIRLYEDDDGVVFTINDSGSGITPDAQKHIFDKFYQSDSSHKSEGNGLGLALVKRIVSLCSGTISVENTQNGSCFTVKLPSTNNSSKKIEK